MNVVFLQLRRVGDIVMTTPALRALKARFPQAEVTFVCERPFGTVLHSNPHLDTLLSVDPVGGWKDRLRLTATLRERRFDLAMDFDGSRLTALLTAGSGAARRVGWRAPLRGAAYTDTVEGGHLHDGYLAAEKLALLSVLGIEPRSADPRPVLVVDPRARDWATRTLEGAGVGSGTLLVTLAPWARSEDRSWPFERWAALLDRLAATHAFETVLLLGPGDERLGEALARNTAVPLFQLSTPPTVTQMAALLDRSDLHLGNENAARHVAAALGTATVTTFAHAARRRWTLPGAPLQAGVEPPAPAETSPAAAVAGPPAIGRIGVDDVHAAVLGLEAYLPRLRAARIAEAGQAGDRAGDAARQREPHGTSAAGRA